MKKRSLVAALAMLVVSAIVLTSSTYAWFATSSEAKVEAMSAKVSNNDGSLTVQATGDWAAAGSTKKTVITASDYLNTVATKLIPVSVYLDNGFKAGKVEYDAASFKNYSDANPNTEYLTYQFTVEYVAAAETDGKVFIKPTFTTTSEFCYGLLAITVDGTTTYHKFASSGSYEAVKACPAAVTDNGNSIIDSADTGYSAANMVADPLADATPAASGTSFELMNVTKNTTGKAVVDVYVWAEGQDAQCTGNVSAADSYFTFDLNAA